MFNTNVNDYYGENSGFNPQDFNQEAQRPVVMKYTEHSVIYFGLEPFFLVRQIRKETFKSMEDVKIFKEFTLSDKVKENNGYYFFVRDIPEIEFEEIIENEKEN